MTAKRHEVVRVVREVRAWDLGADDWMGTTLELIRVKGGRALYEECCSFGDHYPLDVRLGRVDSTPRGLHSVIRWIDGDTRLEIVEVRAP